MVYVVKRLLSLIPVLFGVSILAFCLVHMAPGDPAMVIAGQHASPQTIREIREKYGLDRPIHVQYGLWLWQVLHGDFGTSILSHGEVVKEISERFPNTIELAIFALAFGIAVGLPAGVVSASRQYSAFDYISMGTAIFGISVPVYWLGIMLMLVFGVYLHWLPIGGRIDLLVPFQRITGFMILDSLLAGNLDAFASIMLHLILPSAALGTIPMAQIARVTRSSMLEVSRLDFVRTERAKGLSEGAVIFKHVLRNAMIPITTVVGLNFGLLIGGAILTETVFSWPGMGRYIVQAIYNRDYPVIQACIVLFAFLFVMVNLLTDIAYTYIDPRIRYTES
jgi:peptide/nickel transport system permease protein